MSVKSYILYKLDQAKKTNSKDSIKTFKRPRFWLDTYAGLFFIFSATYFLTREEFFIWLIGGTGIIFFSILIHLDYKNSPHRAFMRQKLVEKTKEESV